MPDHTETLRAARAELVAARVLLNSATQNARLAAIEAAADDVPETVIARELGVDRARTVRRWLGKM